jgi:hypothetical protein
MLNLPGIEKHDAEPVSAENPPYQRSVVYRADDYSSLRYKLVSHLAEAFPNWNRMLADKRGEQDFGVAFIELFSYMADVLGFYQDCRANEAFLRTATLSSSLIDLCALIDYRTPPGASAAALQAFFCKAGQSGTIPAGFKVKTKPQPGAQALVFETSKDLDASDSLNQLFLQGYNRSELHLSETGVPAESTVLLDQAYAGLKAGQFVVMTCPGKNPIPLQLLAVEDENGKRRLRWKPGALPPGLNLPLADVEILGKPKQRMKLADSLRADEITAGQTSVRVETASIFPLGWFFFWNFYCPIVFVSDGVRQPAQLLSVNGHEITWAPGFNISLQRSTTSVYASQEEDVCGPIAPGDQLLEVWVGSLQPGATIILFDLANVALARIAFSSGSSYTLAEPVQQAFPFGALIFEVKLPQGNSAGQNFTAVSPVRLISSTQELVLDKTYDDLVAGQRVVISDGEFTIVRKLTAVEIDSQQRTRITLSTHVGHPLNVANTFVHGPFELTMRVDGYNKSSASLAAGVSSISLDGQVMGLAAGRSLILESAAASEGVRVLNVALKADRTEVYLEAPLQNGFPLAATTVLGNVVEVTHGSSVIESPLGSGDQSQANQKFTLHQKPTTYVHDPQDARGIANTLQVLVGDEQWKEVESLAESGPGDHHYMVQIDEDQKMSFLGGDGRYGAAFPTGNNNISVRYRTALGTPGNVPTNLISVVATPLPFVQSTRNPVPGNGGADPDGPSTTKSMAAVTVRTLDRAVTVQDYRDLALSYPGIAKANARRIRKDGRAIIDLVVATTGGLPLNSVMRDSLIVFLQDRSTPDHLVLVRDFTPVPIRLMLEVHVQENFLRAETGLRIQKALSTGLADDGGLGYFHFDRRALGEDLYLSDVYALVEDIEGVDFLIVKEFRKEEDTVLAGQAEDVLSMPTDGVATGGDATDTSVGTLAITLVGGIA